MSGSKRPGGAISSLLQKQARTNETAAKQQSAASAALPKNPFLTQPVNPEEAIRIFLRQARSEARKKFGNDRAQVEIEARLGILKSPYGLHEMRVASSGPKRLPGGGNKVAHAFWIASDAKVPFEGGITRSHFSHWTMAGLSEPSPISAAFGVRDARQELSEHEYVETVYGNYPQQPDARVCFLGGSGKNTRGKMERKSKMAGMDICLPASPYDLRLGLATEQTLDADIRDQPPSGYQTKRVKRRRSYTSKNKRFYWQLDVTEVTTTTPNNASSSSSSNHMGDSSVSYEIEIELDAAKTLELVNEENDKALNTMCTELSKQLWYMLSRLNPVSDVLDVEEFLVPHPDAKATRLALAQCGALKKFVLDNNSWTSAIGSNGATNIGALAKGNFIGCMPVNFSRHNIEEVQTSPDNGYFLSEKTDGVRYLMVFTGTTVVLVDRSMKGNQIRFDRPTAPNGSASNGNNPSDDPMSPVLPLVKPGTVLDGEVVMHRKFRRPIFIVFDVLAISTEQPVLHLPFEQRLQYLRHSSFRTDACGKINGDPIFDPTAIKNPNVALPLVRKNFVKRTALDQLFSHVVEERGTRTYRNGEIFHHLTDGIIFQPNMPYTCGTDIHLLKWKYLDTVTIDVEILPPIQSYHNNNGEDQEDILRVGVLGDEGSLVDMTRFVKLPSSERRRLEADRHENHAKIAEVGFDPTTGEWYYLTMRPDKIAANHISTVLGTLLELAESLSTEELRYRMSVPPSSRDTYHKDVKGMLKQILEHQRKKNRTTSTSSTSTTRPSSASSSQQPR